jgi:hypothetical protein
MASRRLGSFGPATASFGEGLLKLDWILGDSSADGVSSTALASAVRDGNIDEVSIVSSWAASPLAEVLLGSTTDFEGLLHIGDTNGEMAS